MAAAAVAAVAVAAVAVAAAPAPGKATATTLDGMRGSDKEVFRSFATIAEMLVDRGVDPASLASLAPRDVVAISGGRLVFHVDVPMCGVRVVYNLNPRFKLAAVRKLLDVAATPGADVDSDGIHTFVIVSKDKPIHNAIKGINDLNLDIQLFQLKELQYNVSRHILVPKHEPIRDEVAIEEVLRAYNLKSRFHLPLILSTDPMARYLALKPGQLTRITRFSPSSGTYVLYRCCQKAAT
jgi:DNA-directed RNA polymerase subunit H (RpoH/RPB5)